MGRVYFVPAAAKPGPPSEAFCTCNPSGSNVHAGFCAAGRIRALEARAEKALTIMDRPWPNMKSLILALRAALRSKP